MRKVRLKKKLERVIANGHPWIFRDAISGDLPRPGQVITVLDRQSRFLARGLAEAGPIGVRVMTTEDTVVDAGLFARRIQAAADLRRRVVPPDTSAYRLLHGEGDRIPGVVCDVYGEYAVLQFDGQAAAEWLPAVRDGLDPVLRERKIGNLILHSGYRNQRRARALRGELPRGTMVVHEHGMLLEVDVVKGQKTGMFMDHRESRYMVRGLVRDRDVLNLFGYTGGFSVAAGLGGARRVVTVDRSAEALELAERNWAKNGLPPDRHSVHAELVRDYTQTAKRDRERYGLVISDPPSFAPSERKVRKALDAYRALHSSALGLLEPGGLYLAASCSSHVRMAAFEKTILRAAHGAGKLLQVLERRGAPADHPRLAAFEEGDYLKVILARLLI